MGMSADWVAAAVANVACRDRTTRMTRPCADRTFRRRMSTTPATKLVRAPHPRASSARRRQASQRRTPSSRSCAQSFRRTSPYQPAAGEGAFQRLDVAGLALVIGGERSPERSTVRYCDRPCPPAVTASRKVQKECRGFGGKLSHRTTSSDVSPRCRIVGMMDSRPRTIVTLTRGFATKPEWHTPEFPGRHITKSPQIRA